MTKRFALACLATFCLALSQLARANDDIPKAAWKRPIGAPLANAGTKKPTLDSGHIDNGFWQGAPVGGFGAGTFSRTYRGDFARWHMKAGVHKYQTVWANQFAMFQKSEGDAEGVAKVLTAAHPQDGSLRSWDWDYPVGAGDYYALYPKSWFDYRWEKFPAHVTVEQFSPILPDNYKETSYPVAVSVLLSWENMLGWFRTFSRDLSGGINDGNHNQFRSETIPLARKGAKEEAGSAGTMKGILFDRNHLGPVQDEWDGQFAIAALESPGVEISYQTTFSPGGDGKEVWALFAKDGKDRKSVV